jgi:hypothetical protein
MARDDQQTGDAPYLRRTSMKARQVFIALMTGKGYTPEELEWNGSKFINSFRSD